MAVIDTVVVEDCDCCNTNVPDGNGTFQCVQERYNTDVSNVVLEENEGVCWGHLVSDVTIDCFPFPYVPAFTDRYEVNYTVSITGLTPGQSYRCNVEITRCTEDFWDDCAGYIHNWSNCSNSNAVNLIYQLTEFVANGNTYEYSEYAPIVADKFTGPTDIVDVVAI